jgi:glycosyltransferase involved in cell wall biosynthesis
MKIEETNKSHQAIGKNTPLVSILMPVYNREALIAQSIESAISQNYKNIEIIIVDNCSSDNTLDICMSYAKTYPQVKVFKNNSNIGVIANFLLSYKYSSGEYVKYLFSDDEIRFDCVGRCVQSLKDESIGFVLTGVLIKKNKYSKHVTWSKKSQSMSSQKYIDNVLHYSYASGTPGNAMFRAQDIESSLFVTIKEHENFKLECRGAGNDIFMMLFIASKYAKIGTISDPLATFGTPDDSISMSFSEKEIDSYRFCYTLAKLSFLKSEGGLYQKNYFYFYLSLWIYEMRVKKRFITLKTLLERYGISLKNKITRIVILKFIFLLFIKIIYKKLARFETQSKKI